MKKLITLLSFIFLHYQSQAQEFITRWDLSSPATTSIKFTIESTGSVPYTWETVPSGLTSSGTLSNGTNTISSLPSGSIIRLKIDTTNFRHFKMLYSPSFNNLIDVEQWGAVHWTSMESAFASCQSLNISAVDMPNLNSVLSMASMFKGCISLIGPSNIGSWNTQFVQDMSRLFDNARIFNVDIGNWNTSSDTTMENMFNNAKGFNQYIGNWNTSAVKKMKGMFQGDTIFNRNIGNWNTSAVTNMSYMFSYAKSFNQNIGNWNTSAVTDMSCMFEDAYSFNQAIGYWNTSAVKNMEGMFNNALSFNQNIGNWNTGAVTSMHRMFMNSQSFNQYIGNWNTSSVTTMSLMFFNNYSFNQYIGNWNTSSVTTMSSMFFNAFSFNQNIGNWNTSSVESIIGMFGNASAFNQNISGWNTISMKDMGSAFRNATSFNQNISNWNTTFANSMSYMFFGAKSFNQNLGNWKLNGIMGIDNMLDSSGLDCENYSSTLIGWSNNIYTPSGKTFGAKGLLYDSNAIASRDNLINTKGWTINGDALSAGNCLPTSVSSFDREHVINLFPNPASNQVHLAIKSDKTQDVHLYVYNSLGMIMNQQTIKLEQGENSFTLDSNLWPNGNYFARLQMANYSISTKFIVSK